MKSIWFCICFFCSTHSVAAEKLYIQEKAVFADGAAARESIKDKCNLEEFFGKKIYEVVLIAIPDSALVSNRTPPRNAAVLEDTILAAQGTGGAPAFFAGNTMTIRSDYKVAGQVVATKVSSVSSKAFTTLGGTCSNLEGDADQIAMQIAKWVSGVQNERMNEVGQKSEASTDVNNEENFVALITPIKYVEGNTVRDSIKAECGLPNLTEAYILNQAARDGLSMKSVSTSNDIGNAMRVSISDVNGIAGGIYTGTKAVVLHTDLLKDGKVIASEDFDLHTHGASFGGLYGGSCFIFNKLVKKFAIVNVRWVMKQLSIERQPVKKVKREKRPKLAAQSAGKELNADQELRADKEAEEDE